jgi:hypothetical protein
MSRSGCSGAPAVLVRGDASLELKAFLRQSITYVHSCGPRFGPSYVVRPETPATAASMRKAAANRPLSAADRESHWRA